jgi:hypothetical protein
MLNRPLPIQTEANNTEPDGTGREHFGGRVSGKKCVSVNQTLGVSGDHDLSGIGSALKRAPTTERGSGKPWERPYGLRIVTLSIAPYRRGDS